MQTLVPENSNQNLNYPTRNEPLIQTKLFNEDKV